MQTVMQTLRSFFDSLLNSPHRVHLMVYAGAAVAALLICIPLLRAIFGSHRENEEDASSLSMASPSMLGLSSLSTDSRPAPLEFTSPAPSNPAISNVRMINESLTVPCTHCGVTMSSRQDFCPACGYAQPVKQSLIAAFPA